VLSGVETRLGQREISTQCNSSRLRAMLSYVIYAEEGNECKLGAEEASGSKVHGTVGRG